MSTPSMTPEAVSPAASGLDEYRISSPSEIKSLLRSLIDSGVPLNINGSDGSVLNTTLWTVDALRGTISFSASVDDPQLQQILQCDEAAVVGYLDSVKVQFDTHNLMLVHADRRSALSCAFPDVVYRFQRRNAFRVRPVLRSSPVARFRHPELAEMQLALRVLDVSIGGCALHLPDNVPALTPGITLNAIELELDAETRFTADLRMHHISSMGGEARGVRLGCELLRLSVDAQRQLQRYIDQTQKRRRLMALE